MRSHLIQSQAMRSAKRDVFVLYGMMLVINTLQTASSTAAFDPYQI